MVVNNLDTALEDLVSRWGFREGCKEDLVLHYYCVSAKIEILRSIESACAHVTFTDGVF